MTVSGVKMAPWVRDAQSGTLLGCVLGGYVIWEISKVQRTIKVLPIVAYATLFLIIVIAGAVFSMTSGYISRTIKNCKKF